LSFTVRVDEEKLGKINELGDIQPGHTKKAFDLTPASTCSSAMKKVMGRPV
jgi:hypothetical protein